MIDLRLHNRIVIISERNLGTIRFEQVLIDMEARAKQLERSFEPLDSVLLVRVIEARLSKAQPSSRPATAPSVLR